MNTVSSGCLKLWTNLCTHNTSTLWNVNSYLNSELFCEVRTMCTDKYKKCTQVQTGTKKCLFFSPGSWQILIIPGSWKILENLGSCKLLETPGSGKILTELLILIYQDSSRMGIGHRVIGRNWALAFLWSSNKMISWLLVALDILYHIHCQHVWVVSSSSSLAFRIACELSLVWNCKELIGLVRLFRALDRGNPWN